MRSGSESGHSCFKEFFMQMKKRFPYLFGILAASVMLVVSCGKPADTTAVVKVITRGGAPVSGATVHVIGVDSYGNNGGRIDHTSTTDANGNATFNFNDLYKRGQAGFAVLEVRASKDTLIGEGIIKVEEEKKNEAQITLQ